MWNNLTAGSQLSERIEAKRSSDEGKVIP